MIMAQDQRFVTRDADDLAKVVARWLAGRIARKPGRFSLALCGGRTPLSLYRLLGSPAWAETLDWSRVHIFWGDERLVPRHDPASNAGNARSAWLDKVNVPAAQVHMMPIEPDPGTAALRYEHTLRTFYGHETLEPGRPLFDVVLLGVGADGHTASVFPGDPMAANDPAWARGVVRSEPPARMTLTLPVLRSARSVAFLVAGEDKAPVMQQLAAGDTTLPAAQVQGEEETLWFLDKAAAKGLT